MVKAKWLLRFSPTIIATVLAGVGLGYYFIFIPDPFLRLPGSIRTLKRNQEAIETYIGSINAGRIPLREGQRGYFLLDVLARGGATYVQKDGDCVVITFEFMPTDAVPELIYSPRGSAGLPKRYQDGCECWSIFEKTQIDAC